MGLFGGLFLGGLGGQTFRAQPAESAATAGVHGRISAYASTFLLPLTNPLTILSFAAMFAGAGLGEAAGSVSAASFLVTGALRGRFDRNWQRWRNRLSGIDIASFGFWHLSKLVLP